MSTTDTLSARLRKYAGWHVFACGEASEALPDIIEAAVEIYRLTGEVEKREGELGCAYREVARFEEALGEQETKADALAEALVASNILLKAEREVFRDNVADAIIDANNAALTAYREQK